MPWAVSFLVADVCERSMERRSVPHIPHDVHEKPLIVRSVKLYRLGLPWISFSNCLHRLGHVTLPLL